MLTTPKPHHRAVSSDQILKYLNDYLLKDYSCTKPWFR